MSEAEKATVADISHARTALAWVTVVELIARRWHGQMFVLTALTVLSSIHLPVGPAVTSILS